MSDENTATDTPVIAEAVTGAVTAEPIISAPGPVSGVEPTIVAADAVSPLEPAYVRAELDAVRFSIVSGVSNGLERIASLMRYIDARI